ncbi:M67 family metallopeptidase [Paenibacillus guangzhouensis]|uniref:M67 family metallopeptidase n=1 Tax=Paenibacillus guangzhouensis TaxID=1473112 RepID=UPI0012672556|nr:M67 family metallopeptidase [Paenibacillus guangzhouensis]
MDGFVMTTNVYRQMANYCVLQQPIEACGFLSGSNQVATRYWPIRNDDQSPVSFTMNPVELDEAFTRIEASGEACYAMFHSHPTGLPYPSPFDIEHMAYPISSIIVSLIGNRPRIRSFTIQEGKAYPERIILVPI